MRTEFVSAKEVEHKWYLVDAASRVLGRLASEIAQLLIGKYEPWYAPSSDMCVHVVIINADKVVVTGKKERKKEYYRYTGYPGGMRSESYAKRATRKPELILRSAVFGMLPKTILGKRMKKRLIIYAGSSHLHQAQRPLPINFFRSGPNGSNEFKEVVVEWLNAWLDALPADQRSVPVLFYGECGMTVAAIREEVTAGTEFGKDFARSMHKLKINREGGKRYLTGPEISLDGGIPNL